MKIHKILFTTTMITGTIISVSSYSWMSMWMGLEINLLSIIPLLTNQKNIYSSEASMKYFITQAIASLIVLMSALMMLIEYDFIAPPMNNIQMMLMNSALLTKLGAAPFHFWFPEVVEGLSWTNCLIMFTWQKIAPFMLIMNSKTSQTIMLIVISACLITSTIMSINQVSLRKIMAYSSINHIAWMIAAAYSSMSTWTLYFLVYSLINLSITMSFKNSNLFFMKQMFSTMNKNKMIKFSVMINFLSLGGMPPFIGFLPKWLVIQSLTSKNFTVMAFMMIIVTLIMLFIYIRMTSTSLILSTSELNMNKEKSSKMMSFTNFINMTFLIMSTSMFNLM